MTSKTIYLYVYENDQKKAETDMGLLVGRVDTEHKVHAHNSLYACDLEDSLFSTLLTFQEISAYVNFSQSVSIKRRPEHKPSEVLVRSSGGCCPDLLSSQSLSLTCSVAALRLVS